jgi:hypothetical protein
MRSNLYERITNVTFVVAVGSALLFDRAGNLSWLSGGIGIAAAVVAVGAYFKQQRNEEKEEKQERKLAEAPSDLIQTSLLPEIHKNVNQAELLQRGIRSTIGIAYGASNTIYVEKTHMLPSALWRYYEHVHREKLHVAHKAHVVLQHRPTFAEEVTEIVEKLTKDEASTFEFKFSRDGSLTFRKTAPHWKKEAWEFDEKDANEQDFPAIRQTN